MAAARTHGHDHPLRTGLFFLGCAFLRGEGFLALLVFLGELRRQPSLISAGRT